MAYAVDGARAAGGRSHCRASPGAHRASHALLPSGKHRTRCQGSWRRYYERWRDLTLERIEPRLLGCGTGFGSARASCRNSRQAVRIPRFPNRTCRLCCGGAGSDGLVVSGAETDVCVLATVLDAVDLGYRVVLATDALCSSSDTTPRCLADPIPQSVSVSRSKLSPARSSWRAGTKGKPRVTRAQHPRCRPFWPRAPSGLGSPLVVSSASGAPSRHRAWRRPARR